MRIQILRALFSVTMLLLASCGGGDGQDGERLYFGDFSGRPDENGQATGLFSCSLSGAQITDPSGANVRLTVTAMGGVAPYASTMGSNFNSDILEIKKYYTPGYQYTESVAVFDSSGGVAQCQGSFTVTSNTPSCRITYSPTTVTHDQNVKFTVEILGGTPNFDISLYPYATSGGFSVDNTASRLVELSEFKYTASQAGTTVHARAEGTDSRGIPFSCGADVVVR